MRKSIGIVFLFLLIGLTACGRSYQHAGDAYLDSSGRSDRLSGGERYITIKTAKGDFKVWTKRVGNNPRIKVLLLHGGPGANHTYFNCADSYLPAAGIEYYYYDQLGSWFSDQPKDTSLWNIPRFVEEVEQVRRALHLNKDNFYLLGHSWGGILAMEYALKYQQHLKGLIISNMMASIPAYMEYAEKVLGPQLPPRVLKEIRELEARADFANPRYMALIEKYYYPEHVLRMPLADWPVPVQRSFAHTNQQIYVMMQGPSEFGVAGDATLKNWDRSTDLSRINVPTLIIGAGHDTMDPAYMKRMSGQVRHGRFLLCPNGGHMAMYDDQQTYFSGLIRFLKDVDAGRF